MALNWIQDTDCRDLSSHCWYKIRFPDGSELAAGQKSVSSDTRDAIVGPPNSGVAVTISSTTSAEVCLQAGATGYLKGMVPTGEGTSSSMLELNLSLNEAGNQLYWWYGSGGSNPNYGIMANQLNGRVGLFAKDKNGETFGLRAWQHGGYLEIHSENKCKIPLECVFVRIRGLSGV